MGIFKKKDAPETPSAEASFLDQVESLGKAYEKYLPIVSEYEPKFLEQQLKMQEEFAQPFAEVERDILETVNPEVYSALNQLSQALTSRGDLTSLDISPEITKALQQEIRGSQAARGMVSSPVSALTEAQATLGARISERDKWLNLAQALAGGAPTVTAPTVAGSQFGAMGTPQITAMTSLQQQANNLAFSRWDREQQERMRRYEAIGNAFGGSESLVGSTFTGRQFNPTIAKSAFGLS